MGKASQADSARRSPRDARCSGCQDLRSSAVSTPPSLIKVTGCETVDFNKCPLTAWKEGDGT